MERWAGVDLVLIETSLLSYGNDALHIVVSRKLRTKSSEVSIKSRSMPASLSFKGQATKHTTVKSSIALVAWVSPKSLKILLYTKLHYIKKASVSPTDAQLGPSCGLSSEDRAPSFLRGFTPSSCEHLDWLFFFL